MTAYEYAARVSVAAVRRAVSRIAAAAEMQVPPDVRVTVEGDGVVLTGRGLGARAITDPRLRGVGR